jgi:hypothetical protein
MATRPHYRGSHEKDRLTAITVVSFMVGILIGVTLALGFVDLTGGI